MQTLPPPRVESISSAPVPPGRGARRAKVFFGVLIPALLIGLTIVFARDPIYRATASVLTVKPKAVDTRSTEADAEHVAIQERLLLGEELLTRLADDLADTDNYPAPDELRAMLSIVAVPDTNLLELRAEGPAPAALQRLINSWAKTYEVFRAEEVEALSGRTISEIEEQQRELDLEITTARNELQKFRETHDIVSLERSENRSLSSLQGLNASLNKARERLVDVQARQAAIASAIQRGETVVPDSQKSDLAKLRVTLQRAKARLVDLRGKFTDVYIEMDPNLKTLPDEIRDMEQALKTMQRIARETVVDEANQDLLTAEAAVASLETQLTEQQRRVQLFTERFKEFKALEDGLSRLETLYADNAERLARIQIRNLTEYPPIEVVDWARLPDRPISPDYQRDLFIALGSAVALAIFVTWLIDYLSTSARTATPPTTLDVHIHSPTNHPTLDGSPEPARLHRNVSDVAALQSPATDTLSALPREFATSEVQALLARCDANTRGYAALLLNGLSPYELPLLHVGCFDQHRQQLSVEGANRRSIDFSEMHWTLTADVRQQLDSGQPPQPVAEINQRLEQAATDAGIAQPASANALALWHSYLLFLVRQGIDAGSLTQRVGSLPAELQGTLMHFVPPGGSRPLGSIAFSYPLQAQD